MKSEPSSRRRPLIATLSASTCAPWSEVARERQKIGAIASGFTIGKSAAP